MVATVAQLARRPAWVLELRARLDRAGIPDLARATLGPKLIAAAARETDLVGDVRKELGRLDLGLVGSDELRCRGRGLRCRRSDRAHRVRCLSAHPRAPSVGAADAIAVGTAQSNVVRNLVFELPRDEPPVGAAAECASSDHLPAHAEEPSVRARRGARPRSRRERGTRGPPSGPRPIRRHFGRGR